MLRIAVCDDEKNMIGEICKIISVYCEKKQIEHKIFSYIDGEDLLNSKERFDIIFLDIEMKHMDGIVTAEHIREQDMNVPIIYITEYTDHWRRAFKVHAFGYITKPIKDNELYNVMDDYLSSVYDANDDTLILPTDDGVAYFKMNEIYYFIFEAKKKVYVRTADERILVREHLSNIYEKLDKTQFYQSRRDCVLNLRYVSRIQNEFVIVMKNGDMLPLAQKKKDDFINKLSNYFIDKLKGRNYE